MLTLFDGEHIYFGQRNQRAVDVEITFPDAELGYESITLNLALRCPNGTLCDWWDRHGHLGIVNRPGSDEESLVEIARFITPYRVEAAWTLDVTSLRPLLAGTQTVRVFIDTWVGPGHANGEGWLVDASLDMVGGIPDPLPIAVVPVWNETTYETGNPGNPIAAQVPDVTVEIPAEATRAELRTLITGHGQGNAENCAEFCPKVHGFQVGTQDWQRTVWRDDCAENPVQPQAGTWQYPRAGWCPGADVIPWVEDVTEAIEAGTSVTLRYATEPYENTCRPDASPCSGCTLGTGCDYDGGNHTMPVYKMSAAIIVYR